MGTAIDQKTERWVLQATIIASSMAFIDSTALNVAQASIQEAFNATVSQLAWMNSAYTLGLAALILVGGALGDHYGRKRIFTLGIIWFTAASVVCGLAPNMDVLIAARAAKGIGGALMIPGSLAIISALFAPERRGTAIGTWSALATLATIIGPVLGGLFASQPGLWRGIFFINVPLAAVALFALRNVPESRDEHAPPQLDVLGALLIVIGLAALSYAFLTVSGAEGGFRNPLILGALGVGIVALVLFIAVQARVRNPMMPLDLFRSRTFAGTNALTLFLYAALYGGLYFLPLNLIQVQGYPSTVAGFANLPSTLALLLLSRWSASQVPKRGVRPFLIVGPILAGVGFALLSLPQITTGPSAYFTTYFPGILLFGVGMGLTVAPLTTAVMGSAPQERSGTASGVNNAISRVAAVLGVAIFTGLAISAFGSQLGGRVESLPPPVQQHLLDNTSRLALAAAPEGAAPADSEAAQQAVRESFVATFRLIMLIGAGLAFASAALAALLIEGRSEVSEVRAAQSQPATD